MKRLILFAATLFTIHLTAQSGLEVAFGGGVSSSIYKETYPAKSISYYEPKIRPSYYLGLGYAIQSKKSPELHFLVQARLEAKGMNIHWETNNNWPGIPSSDYKQPAYYASIRTELQYELLKGIYTAVGLENGYMFSKYNEDLKDILGEHRYDFAGLLSLGYQFNSLRLHLDYSRSILPMGLFDASPGAHSPNTFSYFSYFIHLGIGMKL